MEQVNKSKGVSLIELMIAMSICGILGAVAVPSYQSTIKQARKRNIQVQMLNIHLQQQAYHLGNRRYASKKELAIPEEKHYRIAIEDVSASSFVIKVRARKHQKIGGQCDDMSINANLARMPEACW